MIYTLWNDTVVEVRMNISKAIYTVALRIRSESKYFDELISHILKLFSSAVFRDRQVFLYICEGFMCNEQLFEQCFLTQFLTLQKDRIVNIRVTLAKILHNHMKNSGVLAKNLHIIRTIQLLQSDTVKEVKECIVAASKECDKMKDAELEKLAQKEEPAAVEVKAEDNSDEEEIEERNKEQAEIKVKDMKIDEIDEKGMKGGKEEKKM